MSSEAPTSRAFGLAQLVKFRYDFLPYAQPADESCKRATYCWKRREEPKADQPDERLVDEGRGLQHMPRPLSPEVAPRQPPKLGFDQRDELVEGRATACPPGIQQQGDLRRRGARAWFCRS